MINHLSFGVSDLDRSTRFYDAALAPLGYVRLWTNEKGRGYGVSGIDEPFAIFGMATDARSPGAGFHVAFEAQDRAAVDAFHKVALLHGGTDEGAPGLRPRYGPGYYAAFVRDPDGYRLEAVCHEGAVPSE